MCAWHACSLLESQASPAAKRRAAWQQAALPVSDGRARYTVQLYRVHLSMYTAVYARYSDGIADSPYCPLVSTQTDFDDDLMSKVVSGPEFAQ